MRRGRPVSSEETLDVTPAHFSALLKGLTRRGSHPHLNLSSNGLLPSIEPLTISADLVSRFPNGLLPISQWTALSVDNRYLTHLLNLFFAWDGALSHTIHRTAFLEGIKSLEASATLNVCSKFLVHSLLAVSHLYLSHGASPSQVRELRSRGREFADEALRALNQKRMRPSIPLAQGLVLLWAYEVNFGQENGAVTLLDEFYRIFDALATNIVVDEASGKGEAERDRRNGPKAALCTLSVEWLVVATACPCLRP